MKKTIIWIVAVVLVLALLAGGAVGYTLWVRSSHGQAQELYVGLQEQLNQAALTVKEGENVIGAYSLEDLGLLEQALADADSCFTYAEKLTKEEFAQLPIWEQWQFRIAEMDRFVTVDVQQLDFVDLLVTLMDMEREVSADSYIEWGEDGFTVVPAVFGTDLNYEIVCDALERSISDWVATPDAMEARVLDVAAIGAYTPPTVVEEETYDFAGMLAEKVENLIIPVKLLTETVEVPVQPLVTVDEEGKSTIDTDTLEKLVDEWVAMCPTEKTEYILDSYERGPVALDFLEVTYSVDREALLEQLTTQVKMLDATELKVPYLCDRNGEPFELGDTYVEVDIYRQKMAFFADGELIAYTDVVSGLPWGYWTWPGLYGVQNKETDCMLNGPDYSVHVDYWVGYNAEYGIHDADWRDIFGGMRYHTNGSHGCVNTPKEAMKDIFEKIEVGDPVVIHFVEDERFKPVDNTKE